MRYSQAECKGRAAPDLRQQTDRLPLAGGAVPKERGSTGEVKRADPAVRRLLGIQRARQHGREAASRRALRPRESTPVALLAGCEDLLSPCYKHYTTSSTNWESPN